MSAVGLLLQGLLDVHEAMESEAPVATGAPTVPGGICSKCKWDSECTNGLRCKYPSGDADAMEGECHKKHCQGGDSTYCKSNSSYTTCVDVSATAQVAKCKDGSVAEAVSSKPYQICDSQ